MKKFVTLFLGAAAAAGSFNAQADAKLWLESIKPDYGFQLISYFYNENNLVEQVIHQDDDRISDSAYSMYYYDENNNLVRIAEYQDLFEEGNEALDKYIWVNYVDYKYNTLNQLKERINYNNLNAKNHPDNPKFQLGGVMEYNYDMEGKISDVKTYWDLDKKVLHQIDKYIYNANGFLERREVSEVGFDGNLVMNSMVDYFYDAGDQLVEIQQSQYDAKTDKKVVNYCILYTYDAEGNLIEQRKTSASKATVNQKFEYYYEDSSFEYKASEVVYPLDPEEERATSLYKGLRRVLNSYKQWEVDQNSNQLMLYDTYTYNYRDTRPVTGVESIQANTPVATGLTFAGVSGNTLKLRGLDLMDNVRVYDLAGNQYINTTYAPQGIDVTVLPAGVYVVSTDKGCAKFVK